MTRDTKIFDKILIRGNKNGPMPIGIFQMVLYHLVGLRIANGKIRVNSYKMPQDIRKWYYIYSPIMYNLVSTSYPTKKKKKNRMSNLYKSEMMPTLNKDFGLALLAIANESFLENSWLPQLLRTSYIIFRVHFLQLCGTKLILWHFA